MEFSEWKKKFIIEYSEVTVTVIEKNTNYIQTDMAGG
jgi:hypothetical protein